MKNYTMGKLDTVKRYGVDTLTSALDTPYGKAVVDCVDGILDNTEKYVDYYLPEEEGKLLALLLHLQRFPITKHLKVFLIC